MNGTLLIPVLLNFWMGCSSCPVKKCAIEFREKVGGTKAISILDQRITSRDEYDQALRIEPFSKKCRCFIDRHLHKKGFFESMNRKNLEKNIKEFSMLIRKKNCSPSKCQRDFDTHFNQKKGWKSELDHLIQGPLNSYRDYQKAEFISKIYGTCGCFLAEQYAIRSYLKNIDLQKIKSKKKDYGLKHPRVLKVMDSSNNDLNLGCQVETCRKIIGSIKTDIFKVYEKFQLSTRCRLGYKYINRYSEHNVKVGCGGTKNDLLPIDLDKDHIEWDGKVTSYSIHDEKILIKKTTHYQSGQKNGLSTDWGVDQNGDPFSLREFQYVDGKIQGLVKKKSPSPGKKIEVYFRHPNRGYDRLSKIEYHRSNFMSQAAISLQACFNGKKQLCFKLAKKLMKENRFFEAETVFGVNCLIEHQKSCLFRRKADTLEQQNLKILKSSDPKLAAKIIGMRNSNGCQKKTKEIVFCQRQSMIFKIDEILFGYRNISRLSDGNHQKKIDVLLTEKKKYLFELNRLTDQIYIKFGYSCSSFQSLLEEKQKACGKW